MAEMSLKPKTLKITSAPMYTEIKAKGMFDFIDTFWQLVQIYATLKIQ